MRHSASGASEAVGIPLVVGCTGSRTEAGDTAGRHAYLALTVLVPWSTADEAAALRGDAGA